MSSCILFDLDGVLIDTDIIHKAALNKALSEYGYTITEEEHFGSYRGRPTRTKLKMLEQQKGLDSSLHEEIHKKKQEYTAESIIGNCSPDPEKISLFQDLKDAGWTIGICSNAIRQSVVLMIKILGLTEYTDIILSNQDVVRPKPHPEMYRKAANLLGFNIKDCIIVEDSEVGIKSALASGGRLCYTPNPDETVRRVKQMIDDLQYEKLINVVVPLCGEGSRFRRVGHEISKPFITILGRRLLEWSLECIPTRNINLIMVYRHPEYRAQLELIGSRYASHELVELDYIPQGATMSALQARDLIDNDDELIVMNSDQLCKWNFYHFLEDIRSRNLDGCIPCFHSTHPKWSFARVDSAGLVVETAEKKPISNNATVGIYYFKQGRDFCSAADAMITANDTYNGEYYNCPVYNYMIRMNKRIGIYMVEHMYGLGTPEDVISFVDTYQEES